MSLSLTREVREDLRSAVLLVLQPEMTKLSAMFQAWNIGAPRAYALEKTGQGVYQTYEFTMELETLNPKDLTGLGTAILAHVSAWADDLRRRKRDLEAAGGVGVVLSWRHAERIICGVERDYGKPEMPYKLKARTRIALTTQQQRDSELHAPAPGEEPETIRAPRARLMTEDELRLMRLQAGCDTEALVHKQYWRIPLVGLFVHENWYPLRWARLIWHRIRRPQDYRDFPWWHWWPRER